MRLETCSRRNGPKSAKRPREPSVPDLPCAFACYESKPGQAALFTSSSNAVEYGPGAARSWWLSKGNPERKNHLLRLPAPTVKSKDASLVVMSARFQAVIESPRVTAVSQHSRLLSSGRLMPWPLRHSTTRSSPVYSTRMAHSAVAVPRRCLLGAAVRPNLWSADPRDTDKAQKMAIEVQVTFSLRQCHRQSVTRHSGTDQIEGQKRRPRSHRSVSG